MNMYTKKEKVNKMRKEDLLELGSKIMEIACYVFERKEHELNSLKYRFDNNGIEISFEEYTHGDTDCYTETIPYDYFSNMDWKADWDYKMEQSKKQEKIKIERYNQSIKEGIEKEDKRIFENLKNKYNWK